MAHEQYLELSPRDVTEISLGGQRLLLARPGRHWPARLASHRLDAHRVSVAAHAFRTHRHGTARLRAYWHRYHLSTGHLSDEKLLHAFAVAVKNRSIDVLVLPRATDWGAEGPGGNDGAPASVDPQNRGRTSKPSAPPVIVGDDVSGWDMPQRLTYVIEQAIEDIPESLVEIARSLLTPQGMITLGVFIALEAASHASVAPVAFTADALLIAALWAMGGLAAVNGAVAFGDFVYLTITARQKGDLDRAAKEFVRAVELLGAAALSYLAAWAKIRSVGQKVAAGAAEANSAASVPKPPSNVPPAAAKAVTRTSGAEPDALPISKPTLSELEIAGLRPARVLAGNSDRVAVIGRSMGNSTQAGVRAYAAGLEESGYKAETFDGDRISPEAKEEWAQLTVGDRRLSDSEVRLTKTYQENVAWAEKLRSQGYTVVDLGNPYGMSDSTFYNMEKNIIFGDPTK